MITTTTTSPGVLHSIHDNHHANRTLSILDCEHHEQSMCVGPEWDRPVHGYKYYRTSTNTTTKDGDIDYLCHADDGDWLAMAQIIQAIVKLI